MVDEVTSLSATELSSRLQSGELSATEVVQAFVNRAESVNPRLNAIVVPLFDDAVKMAREADQRRSRGEPLGPLHGLPITIKEMFDVAGTPTTVGLTTLANSSAQKDADVVATLREAGAIVLGKTNVPQLGLMIESDNPVYGRTNHPWDPRRSPGGSSGGEAAIVAASGCAFGLGSDGAASIRQPAHSCGICGIKPTTGRLSLQGHYSLQNFPRGLAQPGPMARRVEDLELALRCLIGFPQAGCPPLPLGDSSRIEVSRLRVGVYRTDGYIEPSPAIQRAVGEAAEALRSIGCEVEEFQPPDPIEAWRLFLAMTWADGGRTTRRVLSGSSTLPEMRRNLLLAATPGPLRYLSRQLLRWRGDEILDLTMALVPQRSLSAEQFQRLIVEKENYSSGFRQAMDAQQLDAILCPPSAVPALKHGSKNASLTLTYTVLYNLLGMPAGVVPVTRVRQAEETDRTAGSDSVQQSVREIELGSAGLPIGVQLAAPHWREDVLLALMKAVEACFRDRFDDPGLPPESDGSEELSAAKPAD